MRDAARPGRFITLEGGEGAGKSGQAKALVARLENVGIRVVQTREPGGSPGAEEIRRLLVEGAVDRWSPMAEALLHTAARVDHVARTIRPALEDGRWVVCDRFFDSTVAYQGYGHELGGAAVVALQNAALGDFGPDLTLILDVPVTEGLARAQTDAGGGVAEDRYERMDTAFHDRLRAGFLEIAAADAERCAVIDATATFDEVTEAVWRATIDRLEVT